MSKPENLSVGETTKGLMMAIDKDRVVRCLAAVDAYRASGQKATAWADANGVAARDLASWCAHAEGWRAWLAGEVSPRSIRARNAASGLPSEAAGFAAWPVVGDAPRGGGRPSKDAQIDIQWPVAGGVIMLSWPLAHARELGVWLKGLGS